MIVAFDLISSLSLEAEPVTLHLKRNLRNLAKELLQIIQKSVKKMTIMWKPYAGSLNDLLMTATSSEQAKKDVIFNVTKCALIYFVGIYIIVLLLLFFLTKYIFL